MNSPNALAAPASVVVAASGSTLVVEIVATANRYRSGVLIANSSTSEIFVQLRPKADPAPTAAQLIAAWSYVIPAKTTLPIAAAALTAIYLAAASAGTANVQEIG